MQFSIYLLLLLLLLLLLPVESFHDDFVGIGCIFDFTVRQPVSIGCHCLAVIVERSIAVLVALSGNNHSSSKWLSKGYVIMLKWSDLLSATVSGFRCRELIYLWCVIWRNISTTIECPAFKKIFFFFFFLLFNFSLSRARSLSLCIIIVFFFFFFSSFFHFLERRTIIAAVTAAAAAAAVAVEEAATTETTTKNVFEVERKMEGKGKKMMIKNREREREKKRNLVAGLETAAGGWRRS